MFHTNQQQTPSSSGGGHYPGGISTNAGAAISVTNPRGGNDSGYPFIRGTEAQYQSAMEDGSTILMADKGAASGNQEQQQQQQQQQTQASSVWTDCEHQARKADRLTKNLVTLQANIQKARVRRCVGLCAYACFLCMCVCVRGKLISTSCH
jgi:hypothetical protein